MHSRRSFLVTSSMAACVVAAHEQLAWAGALLTEASDPRILGLRLATAAPLPAMRKFYEKTLGLRILGESATELTIGGGLTPITFVTKQGMKQAPFYHFAFNIPENRIREARAWQRERTELIPVRPRLRDPSFPDDVVHFRNWNAHSIFFLDPAGNVLEYIARHDLRNASDGPFGTGQILYASEIALIVDDVPAASQGLREACSLGDYRPGSDAFGVLGDERGLLLVFRRGRNMSPGDEYSNSADVFPVQAEIRGGRDEPYSVPGYPYEISTPR